MDQPMDDSPEQIYFVGARVRLGNVVVTLKDVGETVDEAATRVECQNAIEERVHGGAIKDWGVVATIEDHQLVEAGVVIRGTPAYAEAKQALTRRADVTMRRWVFERARSVHNHRFYLDEEI